MTFLIILVLAGLAIAGLVVAARRRLRRMEAEDRRIDQENPH